MPSPTSIPHPREAGGESTFWVKSVTSGGPLESLDNVLGEPGEEIGMSHPKAVASAVGEETTLGGEGAPRGGREGSSPSEGVGEACPSPVIIDEYAAVVLIAAMCMHSAIHMNRTRRDLTLMGGKARAQVCAKALGWSEGSWVSIRTVFRGRGVLLRRSRRVRHLFCGRKGRRSAELARGGVSVTQLLPEFPRVEVDPRPKSRRRRLARRGVGGREEPP